MFVLALALSGAGCADVREPVTLPMTLVNRLTTGEIRAGFGPAAPPTNFRENLRRQSIIERELQIRLEALLAGRSLPEAELVLRAERFACAAQSPAQIRCIYAGSKQRSPKNVSFLSRNPDGLEAHQLVGVTLVLQSPAPNDVPAITDLQVTYALQWMRVGEGW